MARLNPAVAQGRAALRPYLAELSRSVKEATPPDQAGSQSAPMRPLVLVACSGGTDSLALASVMAFEARRHGLRAGAVVVDHGLLEASAEVAAKAARQCADLGLDPIVVQHITVDRQAGQGIEAAARVARYQAFEAAADSLGATYVALAHTLDDQAETVLLALARGAGASALAGMPTRRDRYIRPFLSLRRSQTETIIQLAGLEAWHDPTNQADGPLPSLRSAVRGRVMPLLTEVLGPGVPTALARSASRLAQDQAYLDQRAAALFERASASQEAAPRPGNASLGAASDKQTVLELEADPLAQAHPAIRGRALRLAALTAGATPAALSAAHIARLEALTTNWHGQGEIALPGRITARRTYGKLVFYAFGNQSSGLAAGGACG
ncbi:MAG: tRNA lysidine(34) synthetase TilS [Bifidobacteriaceae bacterium]|jgi:tRNA(Ile)-lysidine synthetase-like protein|nr:tRNA lysidine(34) synthetase TilS [Bifidobacteriaceae bacterium]